MKLKLQKKSLSFWICKKFIKDSFRTKYTKTIFLTTVLGLAIGIAILLTVLSIMNGFSFAAQTRFINLLPHLTINLQEDYQNTANSYELTELQDYQSSSKLNTIQRIIRNKIGAEKISDIYPSFQTKGFIINNQKLVPIYLISVPTNTLKDILQSMGVNKKPLQDYLYPDTQPKKDSEDNNQNTGELESESEPKQVAEYIKGIFISSGINNNLNNHNSVDFALSDNIYKFYNTDIVDTFNASDKLMSNIAIMDLNYAKKLFPQNYINKINVSLVNPFLAPYYNEQLLSEMTFTIENWTQYTGNYFNILEYTKQIMFILLSCIIIVAMFNAVACLSTTLNEKQTEIAILKTIGGKNILLTKVFLIYGAVITTVGLLIGLSLGALLSINIGYLTNLLEAILGYKLVNPQIYFIDFLPAKINVNDIFNIIAFVYVIMIFSLLIPIKKAIQVPASQILKHL